MVIKNLKSNDLDFGNYKFEISFYSVLNNIIETLDLTIFIQYKNFSILTPNAKFYYYSQINHVIKYNSDTLYQYYLLYEIIVWKKN